MLLRKWFSESFEQNLLLVQMEALTETHSTESLYIYKKSIIHPYKTAQKVGVQSWAET